MPKQQHNILVLNGPNLNMLGVREPGIYGFKNLDDIAAECKKYAKELNCTINFHQSNHEGELVTIIQEAGNLYSGIIINGGAYSHTSIALLDALKLLKIPVIEVHISNVFKRESFRHHSYISEAAQGVICGFGAHGYILALNAIHTLLKKPKND